MHPLITAYLAWRRLYALNVFGGREDLKESREATWKFFAELRDLERGSRNA
jgi:hypothetical protein